MSITALSAPQVTDLGVFPPPSVPLLFADGDRYEWPGTGDVWVRADGSWQPAPDDGSGYLTDADVRAQLHRAVVSWDARHRFVPVAPQVSRLPGRPGLVRPTVGNVVQYVRAHQNGGLVPMRDLVAQYDEDAAYDVPAVITAAELTGVLQTIVTEQRRPEVSYDESAGRVYARYQRHDSDGWTSAGLPSIVTCLHVFVLPAADPRLGE